MKKLIFLNFAKDTLNFFIIMCLSVGVIVWTLQAVNYFDFVSQDGHGLKTYFSYIVLNFPKIIHRIIPFIFFITLFYIINEYEYKNELQIFWTFGITKIDFANKIISLSIILTIVQILFGSYLSPLTQFKGRELLKNSNIDFFTSLLKEGKFINAVDGLTIFIDRKNSDNNNFSNIFIDDSTKAQTRMIYAKNGAVIDNDNIKVFKLLSGKVINKDKNKINVFEFEQIDFNLADYTSSTILAPKVQEMPSKELLSCINLNFFKNVMLSKKNLKNCNLSINKEIKQELFKRFYKPLYIPIIAILSCFLIIFPKNNYKYERNKKLIFLITFFILVISEASLRYSTSSEFASYLYLTLPIVSFFVIYVLFYRSVKNA